ncbi:MAG: hypothetical protein HGA22_11225 [Clostridiales bacterium]|nr:hypothetical protein [Clostridiales bacterium]
MDIIIKKVFHIKELAQEFNHLPIVEKKENDYLIKFDYESENGEYRWKGIAFKRAVEFKHTKEKETPVYMLEAYNAVAIVEKSKWIDECVMKNIIPKGKEYIHYLIYFDGCGAYEFIAQNFMEFYL